MVKDFFECQSTDPDTMLHVETFTPSDMEIKGVIQIVHGMTEHLDRYEELGEYFTSKGYAVIGNDILGHGRTRTAKVSDIYMKNWFDAVSDVKLIRQKAGELYPGKPIYISGFSLGSFIVRSLDSLKGYAAEILIGTGYQPTIVLGLLEKYLRSKYRNTMEYASEEIGKLAFENYNNKFKDMPGNYWLLTDEKSRSEYENDKFVKKNFTPGFFCEFLKGMVYTNKKLKNPNNSTIPTFFIYGEKDPVAGFGKGIAKIYHAYCKNNEDTQICCVKDATHDILHDRTCSDITFDKIEAFIHYAEKEKMPKN